MKKGERIYDLRVPYKAVSSFDLSVKTLRASRGVSCEFHGEVLAKFNTMSRAYQPGTIEPKENRGRIMNLGLFYNLSLFLPL